MTSKTKIEQFFDASIDNQIDIVRRMLKTNIHQNKKDEAFGFSIAYGNLGIADLLLENGADLYSNQEDNIYWACHNEEFDSIKFLIDKGIDVNCQHGTLALMISQTGNLDIIKWIDEKGADLHIKNDQPLINAIVNDKTEIAKYLITKGANPNIQNGAPIRKAGISGNVEILKLLISKGGLIEGYLNEAEKIKVTWLINEKHISVINYLMAIDIHEKNRNEFILYWVINYPYRENQVVGKRLFEQNKELLRKNELDIKRFIP